MDGYCQFDAYRCVDFNLLYGEYSSPAAGSWYTIRDRKFRSSYMRWPC